MTDYFDLDSMSVFELDQLLAEIATRMKEERWKETAQRLENEAIDAVQALREFTHRNYVLALGAVTIVPVQKRHLRRVRLDLVAA